MLEKRPSDRIWHSRPESATGLVTPESYSLSAMPIYEYKCKKGHVFETMQSFSDDPLTTCEVCGAPVQRVYHPVSVHFKGSGFYNTDYGTKRRAREKEASKEASSGSSDGGGSTKSETSSSSSESKSDGSSKSDSAKSDSGKSSSSDSRAAA